MERKPSFVEKTKNFSEKHPYAATIGRTALVYGARQLVKAAGKRYGVEFGHGRKDSRTRSQFIEEHPVLAGTLATVVAPVMEEIAFRELPKRYLDSKEDLPPIKRVAAELGVAAVFAAGHAGPNAVPLPQFIGGLNYLDIHRRHGLRHSIVAHVTNNTLSAIQYGIERRRSKQQD